MIRVFVLDDHELVRRGLRQLIEAEPDLRVVGEASGATEAVERAPALAPHVALLDVRLPDGNGIDVCQTLLAITPQLKCLIFSGYADLEALDAARAVKASGFLMKSSRGREYVEAIRRVAAGEAFVLDPTLATLVRRDAFERRRFEGLTERERSVAHLVAEGWTNHEIAESLFLAEKTVKNYLSKVLDKMSFASRTELAVYMVHLAEQDPQAFDGGDASPTQFPARR